MKLPNYVEAIINQKRISVAPTREQSADKYGYTFQLYKKNNAVWDKTHMAEAKKLVAWAKRIGATLSCVGQSIRFTEKEHRKPNYMRDYILIEITDPAALYLEKNIKGW